MITRILKKYVQFQINFSTLLSKTYMIKILFQFVGEEEKISQE